MPPKLPERGRERWVRELEEREGEGKEGEREGEGGRVRVSRWGEIQVYSKASMSEDVFSIYRGWLTYPCSCYSVHRGTEPVGRVARVRMRRCRPADAPERQRQRERGEKVCERVC